MPIFDYECLNCGLSFEKSVKRSQADKAQSCISCHMEVNRKVSSFSYQLHAPIEGIAPPNTGFSELDRQVDKVIGRDSEKSWSLIEKRDQAKEAMLNAYGLKHKIALGRTPDNDYMPLTSEEIQAGVTARNLHNKATNEIFKIPREERDKKVFEVDVDNS